MAWDLSEGPQTNRLAQPYCDLPPGAMAPGRREEGARLDPVQDLFGCFRRLHARWTILDTTPEGRGKDWYPSLSY